MANQKVWIGLNNVKYLFQYSIPAVLQHLDEVPIASLSPTLAKDRAFLTPKRLLSTF